MLRPVPDPTPREASGRGALALRGVATALLALGAILAVTQVSAVERERRDLLAEARQAGVGRDAEGELATLLYRERDAARMRLETARTLLNREIARQPPWVTGETRARLGRVEELASRAALALPANGRALAVYASALVLLRTRTADTRLFTLFRRWERPLERAIELDPSDRFPKETLAFVYLEVWPAIAPEKRPQVERLLVEAFENPATYRGLIGNWIRAAGSLDAAARLVPQHPWGWQPFVDRAARAGDWPAYVRFAERRAAAIAVDGDRQIELADERLAAGDAQRARQILDTLLEQLPPERASVDRLERLLARRPPAPATSRGAKAAKAWLDWQRPLALLGLDALSADATGRLVFLAANELSPEEAAFAYLASGNAARAEVYERRSESLWSARWAPYLTLKARRALERDDRAAARAALERAHRDFRDTLAWSTVARTVGGVAADGGAGATRTPGPRADWELVDWTYSGGTARLELLPEREATGLRVDFDAPVAAGGAIVPYWDGAALAAVPLAPGATGFRLALEVSPEPHLFQLRPLGRGAPSSARVSLR